MTNQLMFVSKVEFPEDRGLDINMMPFIIGDKGSVPAGLAHYWPMVEACGVESEMDGAVGYLTLSERTIMTGQSHRRPGVHTEGHGYGRGWGNSWGLGSITVAGRRQGVYVAATVGACRAWDVEVAEPPGLMGDCSGMTCDPAAAVRLDGNELWWMTDRCPHESLPVVNETRRQWFRLVSGPVFGWYAAHSTPNPLGVLPACPIITGDKFS